MAEFGESESRKTIGSVIFECQSTKTSPMKWKYSVTHWAACVLKLTVNVTIENDNEKKNDGP